MTEIQDRGMNRHIPVAAAMVFISCVLACGCTGGGYTGIVDQNLSAEEAFTFTEAMASFRLAVSEGLINADGFEWRAVYGLRPHPDGTAETWMVGGLQNGTVRWFRSSGGGWREVRFCGPLPSENLNPEDVIPPDRLFPAHASAVNRVFAESESPPVLVLTPHRWELAGTGGSGGLRPVWDAVSGELVGG
ncbi:MAG: hypothetical protein ACXQTN_00770 [Methanoculleaceae archaeon]